jgi:integrase
MANLKLSQRTVDRLPAPDVSGKQSLFWDSDLTGFGVLVSGKTTSKTYVCQRTMPDGKSRRVTVGSAAEIDFDTARARARKALDDMRQGKDPAAPPPPAPAAPLTLQQALDRYLAAKASNLKTRTIDGYKTSLRLYLADWADLPLGSITGDMVDDRYKELGKEKGHATANATMRTLSAVYGWAAKRHDDVPDKNPVGRLEDQWFDVPRREGLVTADDLPRFWATLDGLENKVASDLLKLLLLTGLRRRNATGLQWGDIDFTAKTIRIPARKMKAGRPFNLPMSRPVRDLLVARRALGNATWVFPASSRSGHIESPRTFLLKVAATTGISVTSHDLRRSFASVAETTPGVSFMQLRALIAHTTTGGNTTMGYIAVNPVELAKAAELVGERLVELCQIDALPEGVARM